MPCVSLDDAVEMQSLRSFLLHGASTGLRTGAIRALLSTAPLSLPRIDGQYVVLGSSQRPLVDAMGWLCPSRAGSLMTVSDRLLGSRNKIVSLALRESVK